MLDAITRAVIAKRTIRQKENQIRRGGKCKIRRRIELNDASAKPTGRSVRRGLGVFAISPLT